MVLLLDQQGYTYHLRTQYREVSSLFMVRFQPGILGAASVITTL